LGALNVQQQDTASQMTMAGRGFFFDVRARKTLLITVSRPVHQFLVRLVAADRLEILGACALKRRQAFWRRANMGQCSVGKLASVSFVQRTRKMP